MPGRWGAAVRRRAGRCRLAKAPPHARSGTVHMRQARGMLKQPTWMLEGANQPRKPATSCRQVARRGTRAEAGRQRQWEGRARRARDQVACWFSPRRLQSGRAGQEPLKAHHILHEHSRRWAPCSATGSCRPGPPSRARRSGPARGCCGCAPPGRSRPGLRVGGAGAAGDIRPLAGGGRCGASTGAVQIPALPVRVPPATMTSIETVAARLASCGLLSQRAGAGLRALRSCFSAAAGWLSAARHKHWGSCSRAQGAAYLAATSSKRRNGRSLGGPHSFLAQTPCPSHGPPLSAHRSGWRSWTAFWLLCDESPEVQTEAQTSNGSAQPG